MLHRLDHGPHSNAARERPRTRGGMSVADEPPRTVQGMPDFSLSRGTETDGANFDLRSMVGVLLRRWKLVLAIPIAAGILTAAVRSLSKPQYRSTVEILAAHPNRPTDVR